MNAVQWDAVVFAVWLLVCRQSTLLDYFNLSRSSSALKFALRPVGQRVRSRVRRQRSMAR